MREAGKNASVSWDYQPIHYKGQNIGYPNGDATDAPVIKDELEKLLGYRPVVVDEPTIDGNQTDQTQ
jgi:hypothetical protein